MIEFPANLIHGLPEEFYFVSIQMMKVSTRTTICFKTSVNHVCNLPVIDLIIIRNLLIKRSLYLSFELGKIVAIYLFHLWMEGLFGIISPKVVEKL